MKEKKYLLTPQGYQQLKKEYQRYKEEEAPKAIQRVKQAREMGNLDDNPEYEAAREEYGLVTARLAEIEEILGRVELAQTRAKAADEVVLGSTVRVEIEGSQENLTIVSSVEADAGSGRISDESPVGQALLGKRPGEQTRVDLGHSVLEYKILQIFS